MENKQSGFSLVEMMVVMAVLGIASVGFAMMMVNMQNSMRQQSSKFDSQGLAQELRSALENPTQCRNMLSAVNFHAGRNVVNLTLPGGRQLNSNAPVGGTNVFIKEVVFEPLQPGGTTAAGQIYTSVVKLISGMRDKNGSNHNQQVSFQPLLVGTVSMEMSGANVLSCNSVGNAVQLCQSIGGTMANGICRTQPDLAAICANFGGSFDASNDHCSLQQNNGNNTPSGPSICNAIGGTWNGSQCVTATTVASNNGGNGNTGNNGNGGPNGGAGGSSCSSGPLGNQLPTPAAHGSMVIENASIYSDCQYKCVSGVWVTQGCYNTQPAGAG